jgi:hypothetical protein
MFYGTFQNYRHAIALSRSKSIRDAAPISGGGDLTGASNVATEIQERILGCGSVSGTRATLFGWPGTVLSSPHCAEDRRNSSLGRQPSPSGKCRVIDRPSSTLSQ